MRSDLVFSAAAQVSNRYLLTSIASKATRMLHRPNRRLEDTSNNVLRLFGRANPLADGGPFDAVALTPPRRQRKTPSDR